MSAYQLILLLSYFNFQILCSETIKYYDMTDGTGWTSNGNVKFNSGYCDSGTCCNSGKCLLIYDNADTYSPVIDLSQHFNITVEFALKCAMNPSDELCFYFEYSINGGTNWITQYGSDNTGGVIHTDHTMPSECNYQPSFQIRINTDCTGDNNDCWVDDLYIKGTKIITPNPTYIPTSIPTFMPTSMPTYNPTSIPTFMPTNIPTSIPTYNPTFIPTTQPTIYPTENPIFNPTNNPTNYPTNIPSEAPLRSPSKAPIKDGAAVDDEQTTTATISDELTSNSGNTFLDNELIVLIALIVIGILIICIIVFLFLFCKNRRKKAQFQKGMELAQMTSHSQAVDITNIEPENENEAKTETMSQMEVDSYALKTFLQNMNMSQYYDMFIEEGFGDQMHTLSALTENDLIRMGVAKMAHRRAILQNIRNNNDQIAILNEGNYVQQTGHLNTNEEEEENEDLFVPQTVGNEVETAGKDENNSTDDGSGIFEGDTDNSNEQEEIDDQELYQKGTVTTGQ